MKSEYLTRWPTSGSIFSESAHGRVAFPGIDAPVGHLVQQESSWKRCCSIAARIPSYSGCHSLAPLGTEWKWGLGRLTVPPVGRYFEKWLKGGSPAPKLTHQQVAWVWACGEESDAAESLLRFPAICAGVIWKHLHPPGVGGSVARLAHQRVDILRNGPWAGHLPPKLARQWVTPPRRNEGGILLPRTP